MLYFDLGIWGLIIGGYASHLIWEKKIASRKQTIKKKENVATGTAAFLHFSPDW